MLCELYLNKNGKQKRKKHVGESFKMLYTEAKSLKNLVRISIRSWINTCTLFLESDHYVVRD